MKGSDAGEDGVAGVGGGRHPTAFFVILSVVVLAAFFVPGVAVDLLAKAAEVVVAFVIEVELGPFAFLAVEAVGGGAEPDGGAATFEVVGEGIGLLIGERHEAGVEEKEVGLLENLDIGDGGASGFDVAVLIDSKEDGAFKSVVFREDFGDERAGFLRAVLVVVCDKDDMLAFAQAFGAFKGERCGDGDGGSGDEREDEFLKHFQEVAEFTVRWKGGILS